jgi:hypothetical protein
MASLLKLDVLPRTSFDFTITNAHAECPRRALYEYVFNRRMFEEGPALKWGSAYHTYRELLERGLKGGEAMAGVHKRLTERLCEMWEEPDGEGKHGWRTKGRMADMFEEARQRVEDEAALGELEVIATEMPFAIRLPTGLVWSGKLDQLVRWRGALWVRDFKTTSRMGKTYFNGYEIDHQITGYHWAAEKLSGEPVKGIIVEAMYNTLRQGPEMASRHFMRNESQQLAWMASVTKECEDFQRNFGQLEELGVHAFPQRTTACKNWGGCGWLPACEMGGNAAVQRFIAGNTEERRWDPLELEERVA